MKRVDEYEGNLADLSSRGRRISQATAEKLNEPS